MIISVYIFQIILKNFDIYQRLFRVLIFIDHFTDKIFLAVENKFISYKCNKHNVLKALALFNFRKYGQYMCKQEYQIYFNKLKQKFWTESKIAKQYFYY